MPVGAFVHVHAKVGKVTDVFEAVKRIEGVKRAFTVTGEFDIILKVEAADIKALGEMVLKKIHAVEGVTSTVTSMIVS